MESWRGRLRWRFNELSASDKLTQEQLGEALGVTQGTIGHWLSGRRSPRTLEMYEKLADALGVHPAWLLYGIEQDARVSAAAQRLNTLPKERRNAIITLILDQ